MTDQTMMVFVVHSDCSSMKPMVSVVRLVESAVLVVLVMVVMVIVRDRVALRSSLVLLSVVECEC